MSDTIDLNDLSKEQLIHLVQVRQQALNFHHQADAVLMEKLEQDRLESGDLEKYITAKNGILSGLMEAEEQIIGGAKPLAN